MVVLTYVYLCFLQEKRLVLTSIINGDFSFMNKMWPGMGIRDLKYKRKFSIKTKRRDSGRKFNSF